MTQRTERIDELLRQEISELLAREVADPRIGFATVTDVETAPDLRHARVWVSVIGQPDERAATVRALEHAMPFVRRELGKRLRLRRIPEFTVRLDESIERGTRVMQLISELEAGETPGEHPSGESLPTPSARVHHEGDAPELVIPPAPAVTRRRSQPRTPKSEAEGGRTGGSGRRPKADSGSRGPKGPVGGRGPKAPPAGRSPKGAPDGGSPKQPRGGR